MAEIEKNQGSNSTRCAPTVATKTCTHSIPNPRSNVTSLRFRAERLKQHSLTARNHRRKCPSSAPLGITGIQLGGQRRVKQPTLVPLDTIGTPRANLDQNVQQPMAVNGLYLQAHIAPHSQIRTGLGESRKTPQRWLIG